MGFFAAARFTAAWVATRAGIKSEEGASAVEYGIMVALIVSVVIVAVVFLGQRTSQSFSCAASNINAGTGAKGC